MKPAAPKVERQLPHGDRMRAPADALHCLDQQYASPAILQPARRRDSGRARTDDYDVSVHSMSDPVFPLARQFHVSRSGAHGGEPHVKE
jgi:hypothetical protein